MSPFLGESFNGQLETEDKNQEDGEEKERNREKEDLHGGPPEIFTSESAQTFPVRHPDRFPSNRPDNSVPPAPQPPRRSRDHNWKQLGTTECSATCGKGEAMCRVGRHGHSKLTSVNLPARSLLGVTQWVGGPKVTLRLREPTGLSRFRKAAGLVASLYYRIQIRVSKGKRCMAGSQGSLPSGVTHGGT